MKKQTKQLLALAGVLVLCVGVYAGLRVWNAGAEEREAAAADYVVQLTDVTALSIDNGGGTLAFTKTDDNWTLDTDADFPVDGTYLDALANGLESVEAERILEDPDELADYGLEDPAYTLSAETADGESVTLYLGNLDATSSNRYAMREGDERIYTISTTLATLMDYDLLDLMELLTLPSMSKSTLASATLSTAAESHTLTKNEVSREQEVETDTGEVDENGDPIYETTTETVTTTTWYLDGEEVSSDADGLSDWLSALSSLYLESCYAYKADSDTLTACGLTTGSTLSVTVAVEQETEDSEDSADAEAETATTTETVTLTFGSADSEGTGYYVTVGTPEDGSNIYLVDLDTAQTLLVFDYATLSAVESEE